MKSKTVYISVFGSLLLLTGCGIETASAPLGTWKDIASERYMSIEEVPASNAMTGGDNGENSLLIPKKYNVKLFTYKHRDGDDPATSIQTTAPILLERSVPATMVDGLLTMQVGANKIPMLYHPDGDRVLINGTNEFRRVERGRVKPTSSAEPHVSS